MYVCVSKCTKQRSSLLPVVKAPWDAREWCFCASDCWQTAFLHLIKIHRNGSRNVTGTVVCDQWQYLCRIIYIWDIFLRQWCYRVIKCSTDWENKRQFDIQNLLASVSDGPFPQDWAPCENLWALQIPFEQRLWNRVSLPHIFHFNHCFPHSIMLYVYM